jgi:hypothetical protein
MSSTPVRPFPNSYWVRPGELLAGEYPIDWHTTASRSKLGQLLEAGVTIFLDLTEPGEHGLLPYTTWLQQEAAGLGRSVEHRRLPIPDHATPAPEEMALILDTIDTALAAGQTVYIHCYAGIGRTGTVVGCHLVQHGMGGEQALAEIARLRQGTPHDWVSAPETAAQRRLVREWPTGKSNSEEW